MSFKSSTVNASKVAATLSNFPSFIDPSRLGITTLAQAQSSRFYADSGKVVEWAREVASATEIYSKIASLTSSTVAYCDFDGVRADYAVTDTYGRNAVWTGYRAVWHLNDLVDSTGNGYTLTNNNSVTMNATGKLGGAADFGSSNSSKTLSIASILGLASRSYSITNWISLVNGSASGQGIWTFNDGTNLIRPYTYYESSGGNLTVRFAHEKANSTSVQTNQIANFANNTWYFMAQTYNDSTLRPYINNTAGATQSISGAGTGSLVSTMRLGSHQGNPAPSLYMSGKIDEFRVSNDTKSTDWLTTEYNNQSDESTFWGAWADVGGGQNSAFLMFM